MAGYYVPSSFSANFVNSKKNEDGTYTYDSALNKAGIAAQRDLQQLNKQYNMTINAAHAGHLLSNRGLQASALGTGYKQAFAQNLQNALNQQMTQTQLSVQQTKQNIFDVLGQDVSNIMNIQQEEVNNMRRMASSLEQYHDYLKTLTGLKDGPIKGTKLPTTYVEDQQFKIGDEWTFEDNYDKLFNADKGVISAYLDEYSSPGLTFEDWLRQNSGTTDKDTAWLDWAYGSGLKNYQDFIKNGVNSVYPTIKPTSRVSLPPTEDTDEAKEKSLWWKRLLAGYYGGGS